MSGWRSARYIRLRARPIHYRTLFLRAPGRLRRGVPPRAGLGFKNGVTVLRNENLVRLFDGDDVRDGFTKTEAVQKTRSRFMQFSFRGNISTETYENFTEFLSLRHDPYPDPSRCSFAVVVRFDRRLLKRLYFLFIVLCPVSFFLLRDPADRSRPSSRLPSHRRLSPVDARL